MNMMEFLRLGVDFAILRRERPYVLGLSITDICNLSCRHCRVANDRREMMSYDEVRDHLESNWRRGARVVYYEGGEPYLWRDRRRRLPELIALARQVGYLSVHVYTNGTRPINAPADFTWVSIDGPDDINLALRGVSADSVIANAAAFGGRCGIVFTVNTINCGVIEPFLQLVRTRLPARRVMFFFHTPYYGVDELCLSAEQKFGAIDTIAACKQAGLPVMNSQAGLQAMRTGDYPHPTKLYKVVDRSGDYQCCRSISQPEVCRQCGYSSCAEIMLARNFRPGAIRSILHTW
ncbi:MAG: radical SAM protein [Betaproteobacteria bacterium]|nr:MAG: radical SAM protein [Betaproteobacteria bacterium]